MSLLTHPRSLGASLTVPLRSSAPPRRLYRGNVDFLHRHHRVERAFGGCGIGAHHCVGEGARCDLPRQAPAVFAPAARAFLPAVADDCVPQAFAFRSPG